MSICQLVSVVIICLYFIILFFLRVNKRNKKANSNVRVVITPSKYFDFIVDNVNCKNVFLRMKNRRNAKDWPPPKTPPPQLYKKFTQNGEMPIIQMLYYAQRYSGNSAHANEWNISYINEMINTHKLHKQIGWYGICEEDLIDKAVSKYSITGKDVAVIGSEIPWVEAIVASKNPKSITTIEYGRINSTVPYLKTFTPSEFADNTLKRPIEFDFVISHSSMEHSGLGRYGDELDPDGDIHAAEEVWCMLKNGGYFLVGMPFTKKSYIRWNADRGYGPERMKYFAKNFELKLY